jgi:hypothetical protein
MSTVELAVKKVKKLSAPQARELLGWLDKHQGNGKPVKRRRQPWWRKGTARQRKEEIQGMARIRSRNDRLGAASNVRRTGQTISAVNFVLDTNAVSETRKSRPNPGLIDWVMPKTSLAFSSPPFRWAKYGMAFTVCHRSTPTTRSIKQFANSLPGTYRVLNFDLRAAVPVEVQRLKFEIGENFVQGVSRAVALKNGGQDVAVVGDHGQVAGAFEDILGQTRPFAEYPPAFDPASHDKHNAASAVVGAESGVFGHAPAKFGHHHNGGGIHFAAHVAVKGSQTLRQPRHQRVHDRGLAEMRIPPVQVNRGRFQTDARLDEPRNLEQPSREFIVP